MSALELVKLPLRLAAVLRALTSERIFRLGACGYCNASVYEDDPHLIVHGRVYHAEPCAEFAPAEEELARGGPLPNGYRLPFLP